MPKESFYPEQTSWRRHQVCETKGYSGEEKLRQLFYLAEESIDLILSRLPCSDGGNAQRFASRFYSSVMYVPDTGWHRWTETNWTTSGADRSARRCAQQVGRLMAGEIEAARDASRAEQDTEQLEARVQELRAWSSISAREPRVFALLQAARLLLQRERLELDANPRLLTVSNGTLEALADGSVMLRAHRQWDLITAVLPVVYKPGALRPEIRTWLDRLDLGGDRDQVRVDRGEVRRP